MEELPFRVEPIQLESGRYIQQIVFTETGPEDRLIIATVEDAWSSDKHGAEAHRHAAAGL